MNINFDPIFTLKINKNKVNLVAKLQMHRSKQLFKKANQVEHILKSLSPGPKFNIVLNNVPKHKKKKAK